MFQKIDSHKTLISKLKCPNLYVKLPPKSVFNSPKSLIVFKLDDIPVGQPLVAEELGHVVPDGVGENNDALLARSQICRGMDGDTDGSTTAASTQKAFVTYETSVAIKFKRCYRGHSNNT